MIDTGDLDCSNCYYLRKIVDDLQRENEYLQLENKDLLEEANRLSW